jgi:hypothetical protein
MTPRPLWRWWLFCAALWLGWRVSWRWQWVSDLYSWCVLPEWLGAEAPYAPHDGSEVPF